MYLYHYYDAEIGPFRSLSELTDEQTERVMRETAARKPGSMCARRTAEYMGLRRHYEAILRQRFEEKGGVIQRAHPYYLVVGACPWLADWYEQSRWIAIPVERFDLRTVSFTYGDSHPTFSDRVNDGKPYRKQLYTYHEILQVIAQYGYPQDWNADGRFGPERYIEAHVWSDAVIGPIAKGMEADEHGILRGG